MRVFDKPVIMLTHNDLDGVGSPVIVTYIASNTEDEVKEIFYVNNGHVEKTIDEIIEKYGTDGYKLFICDHSPLKSHYDIMVDKKIDFMIFDHHKSSEVQGLDNVVFDVKQCATKLFFEHISRPSFYDALERFVYHVNDYDMWHHESPHTKRLNELLYETSITDFVKRFSANPYPGFDEIEEIIVSTAEKKRKKYIDRAEKTVVLHTDHEKNRFGVVYAETHQSELGHELIDRLEIDYIFMVNVQGTKVSLRSAGRVDVSEVAKHFGTLLDSNFGGHKAASGFGFKMEQLPKLYYLLETY